MSRGPLPLSTIQSALFEFLRGRSDVVLFGAQPVNAAPHRKLMAASIAHRIRHFRRALNEPAEEAAALPITRILNWKR